MMHAFSSGELIFLVSNRFRNFSHPVLIVFRVFSFSPLIKKLLADEMGQNEL